MCVLPRYFAEPRSNTLWSTCFDLLQSVCQANYQFDTANTCKIVEYDVGLGGRRAVNTLTLFGLPFTRVAALLCLSILAPTQLHPSSTTRQLHTASSFKMGDEVKIDKELFNEHLSHFITAWKNDKRQSSDAVFGGVGSIVVLMGKNEEIPVFHKSNAMHVSQTYIPRSTRYMLIFYSSSGFLATSSQLR